MARSPEHETQPLTEGWQAACASPYRGGEAERPEDHDLEGRGVEDQGVEGQSVEGQGVEGLDWIPARVPGTAAGALRDAGLWQTGEQRDFDGEDWWFRTSFDAEPAAPGEEVVLRMDGIATVSEVYLNGELVLHSDSMFAAHELDVGGRLRTAAANELAIRCRALRPLLAETYRPRARWRTRLVPERNLRFFRTMLLGRAPGFAPGPAVVGPWRGVSLERRRLLAVEELAIRSRLDGEDGVLAVTARLRPLGGVTLEECEVELEKPSGAHRAQLELSEPADGLTAQGELIVPAVERWWPHTHGEPVLHGVRLRIQVGGEQVFVDAGRVGFRELAFGETPGHDVLREGIDLHVNGVRVFARGAVWTPIDPVGMAPAEEELRAALVQAREAGMNMLRLPGTGAYETSAFHDLCDELGMLVWQDFMFANFDYPLAHEPFRESVTREAGEVLSALGGRPSLAVVCGNSEVEQQVAMLGLDPAMGRDELFGELLPGLVRESGVDAVYVPSAPCGGELPFRPGVGIANYYGVGGYRRPLEDARRAGVRFAAECLAFSNVPSGEYPREEGVPQDEGTDWDFKTVRDHYVGLLFGVDPAELEREDRERYVELAREATGETMAEVFGEWRRAASPCGGGMVLWLRDLLPGAGWGVIDSAGVPKPVYHHLARALAPVAIWTIDEGLGGIVVHAANDRPAPLSAMLRVACYRDGGILVEQASMPVELGAHGNGEWNVESVLGHFADASWAYRFGPPAQDAIVVSLERGGGPASMDVSAQDGAGERDAATARERPETICKAIRFPAGRPLRRVAPEELGLSARARALPGGEIAVELSSERLLYGVRVEAQGLVAGDGGFFIEPGRTHELALRPVPPGVRPESGIEFAPEIVSIGALNMEGCVKAATAQGELAAVGGAGRR